MCSGYRLLFLVIATLGYLFIPLSSYGEGISIHILDVGQGDSILLELPNNTKVLVDGGPNGRVLDELSQVLPYWEKDIDIVMLTHSDSDHVSGLVDVLNSYTVDKIYTPQASIDAVAYNAFIAEAVQQRIELASFGRGDVLNLGHGIHMIGLWPELEQRDVSMEGNYFSQVGMLQYGNFELLLTGDIDTEVSDKILDDVHLQHIDALKVPHHGSKFGISPEDLHMLKPKISIISVGSDNQYGHPTQKTITDLMNIDSNILRTDQHGRISIQVNAAGFSILTR